MFFPFLAVGVALTALVLLGVAIRLGLISRVQNDNVPGASPLKYEAIPALLTPAERSFFGVLRQALGQDFHVFPKVRLADIIWPAKGPCRSGWQSALNRIIAKHVDFVLCDLACLKVVGVIELDDSTHKRSERGLRDAAVDAALAQAGIPVVRVPARASYSPAQLRRSSESCTVAGSTVPKSKTKPPRGWATECSSIEFLFKGAELRSRSYGTLHAPFRPTKTWQPAFVRV